MLIGAELTLQIARLVHERSNPSRSPAYWQFWPEGHRGTWAEARAILAGLPKPVFVAPLVEPGALGIWSLASFDEQRRSELAHAFANQIRYYTEKLELYGLTEADRVRFEPATPEFTLSVSEFLRWAQEYAIGVGISLAQSPESRVCRIIIRPPGGGAAPLGTQADQSA